MILAESNDMAGCCKKKHWKGFESYRVLFANSVQMTSNNSLSLVFFLHFYTIFDATKKIIIIKESRKHKGIMAKEP